ncbi:MAG: hypothetical protein J5382_10355 [Bacteroidales bacterium]|nr:hypothetical protein [Bacteroidales bacterium]
MPLFYNPRWPSRMRVYDTLLDENGLPVTDVEGNVARSIVPLEKVVCDRYGNPTFNSAGDFVTETVEELPCSYRTATGGMKDSGDVFVADFKMSTPMLATHLEEGTMIEVKDKTHTFVAVVKKMTTYNWGTNIWIDRLGNEQGEL